MLQVVALCYLPRGQKSCDIYSASAYHEYNVSNILDFFMNMDTICEKSEVVHFYFYEMYLELREPR